MATGRWYFCAECGKEEWAGSLFQALKRLAQREARPCSGCKAAVLQLRFEFNFALGAQGKKASAVAGFLPGPLLPQWKDEMGRLVTLYPFLIVTDNSQFGRGVWLPYFHVVAVEKKKPVVKYGQWAPVLGASIFADLVAQAQAAGHLKPA
jgi:hypothetical protein